jgi:hypothetical protein
MSAPNSTTITGAVITPSDQNIQSHSKAIYISTGSNTFISKRLYAMVQTRLYTQGLIPSTIESSAKKLLSRIYLVNVKNEEELMEFIYTSLPHLQTSEQIGFVAIDNLSFLFRFSDTTYLDRSGNLFSLSSQLRKLANLHQIPVVITNQVSAVMDAEDEVVPALGLVWGYCVGMRIMLRREGVDGEDQKENKGRRVRYASVLQGVNVKRGEVKFVIGGGGVTML